MNLKDLGNLTALNEKLEKLRKEYEIIKSQLTLESETAHNLEKNYT